MTVSPFKKEILAQLAMARLRLFVALLGLDKTQLNETIYGDWSAKDMLVHIGRWDALEAHSLQLIIEGRIDEGGPRNVSELNAQWAAQDADMTLDGALAVLQKERNGLLNVLKSAEDDVLRSTIKIAPDVEIFALQGINNSIEHDDDHAREITDWRSDDANLNRDSLGADSVLVAGLRASRNAVLAVADLIEDADEPIVDEWSLNALLAHLAGWESYLLETLDAGNPRSIGTDVKKINDGFVTSIEDGRKRYKQVRRDVIELTQRIDLAQRLQSAEHHDRSRTIYSWLAMYMEHDLEHADEIYGAWLRKKRMR